VEAHLEPPTSSFRYGNIAVTVKNNGGNTYSPAQVTINFYDSSGAEIGGSTSDVNNLVEKDN
jgi:hypothetical protein